jgi:hypothetical protein
MTIRTISFRKIEGRITALLVLPILLLGIASVNAQSEPELKKYFEGRHVTIKIDMPATKDGVNVYPLREQQIDYNEYGDRIKRNGTSIRAGDSVVVTKVKVNGDRIEFQLAGGGYGTFLDEKGGTVYPPPVEKSRREKQLDREIKETTDERERKRLEDRRDELRRERREEDQRNRALAEINGERQRERVERKALNGGSRFNIHFNRSARSDALTPQFVEQALAKFLDFE